MCSSALLHHLASHCLIACKLHLCLSLFAFVSVHTYSAAWTFLELVHFKISACLATSVWLTSHVRPEKAPWVVKHLIDASFQWWKTLKYYPHWVFIGFKSSLKVKVLVAQECLTLCDPMDLSPPGSLSMEFSRKENQEWVAIPFSRGSSWPRDWTLSPALQADSLLSETLRKPPKSFMHCK